MSERIPLDYRTIAEFCRRWKIVELSLFAGMRDKIIRGYDDVDLHETRKVVTADVPHLIEMLVRLVPAEEE